MRSVEKLIAVIAISVLIGVSYAMSLSHETIIKAIDAGLQECMQSNNSATWKKECK